MAKRNNHWFNRLVDVLKADREEMMESLKDTFRDTYTLKHPTRQAHSPKDELAAFFGLSQEERMRQAVSMGPEAWNEMVDGKMNQLVESLGPAASKMLPWLYGPVDSGDVPIDRDTLEQELLGMLGKE